MNILEVLLGQIPEAIYIALFLILTKNLKKNKVWFIIIMVVDYLLLKINIHFNILFQVLHIVSIYLLLKVLYKDKAKLTDIFTIIISYFIITLSSICCVIICKGNIIAAVITNRIFLFLSLWLSRKNLPKIEYMYIYYWNKSKRPKYIKSTTFRCANVTLFNCLFILLHFCMLVATHYNMK